MTGCRCFRFLVKFHRNIWFIASDLTNVFPITLRIEIQGFDGKFSFLIRPNVELNNFLTFNYLSAEKWKKIDNVSLTSNKLFFIQETDHLGMRWCGSKILDHETANRVFSGQIRCNRNSGISPDFQLASPEDFTIFPWWFSLSTSSMNCFLVHQDLEEHWSYIFSWLWKFVTETDTDVSAAQAECGGQLRK